MDCRTGKVITEDEMNEMILQEPETEKYYKLVPPQMPRNRTGRNQPCPCGSGKKFKKCCLIKE